MEEMIKALNELEINVNNSISNDEEYMLVGRTKNDNMIVVAHQKMDDFGDDGLLYTLEVYNSGTINCFMEAGQLVEALQNYLSR